MVFTQSNVIGEGIDSYSENIGSGGAFAYGMSSGFLYGASELGLGASAAANTALNPYQTLTTVGSVPENIKQTARGLQQLPQEFHRRQQLNNPFSAGRPGNETFEHGFTTGYVTFMAVGEYGSAVAASSGKAAVANAVGKSSKVSRAARLASQSGRIQQLIRYQQRIHRYKSRTARVVDDRIARVYSRGGAVRSSTTRFLEKRRGVGTLVKTTRTVNRKLPDGYGDLPPSHQRTIAKYFRDGDLDGASRAELDSAATLYDAKNPRKVSRLLRRMDDDARSEFLDSDLSTDRREQLYDAWRSDHRVSSTEVSEVAGTYRKLDADGRERLDGLLARTSGDGVEMAAGLDTQTLRRVLTPDCDGASLNAVGGGDRLGSKSFAPGVTVAVYDDSCLDTHREYLTAVAEIDDNAGAFDYPRFFSKTQDIENRQAFKYDVAKGNVPIERVYRQSGIRDIDFRYPDDAEGTQVVGTYRKTDESIETELLYASDGEDYLDAYDDTNDNPGTIFQKLGNKDSGEYTGDEYTSRGDYIEEEIAPDVLEERHGYEIICKGSQCAGGGSDGIDILAWDPDADNGNGELVAIDSKWTHKDGGTGVGILGNGRQVTGSLKCLQMSQCWVDDSINRLPNSALEEVDDEIARQIHEKHGTGEYDEDKKAELLEKSLDSASSYKNDDGTKNADKTNYTRELFVVRPHKSGKAVTDSEFRGRKKVKNRYNGEDLSEFIDGVKVLRFDNSLIKEN